MEAGAPPKQISNIWIKMLVICLILILGILMYQQFISSKIADCRSQAFQVSERGRVFDVRINGFQCEFLVQQSTYGGPLDPPEWVSQELFNSFFKFKDDHAPNK
jgi:hypothetical protein